MLIFDYFMCVDFFKCVDLVVDKILFGFMD